MGMHSDLHFNLAPYLAIMLTDMADLLKQEHSASKGVPLRRTYHGTHVPICETGGTEQKKKRLYVVCPHYFSKISSRESFNRLQIAVMRSSRET